MPRAIRSHAKPAFREPGDECAEPPIAHCATRPARETGQHHDRGDETADASEMYIGLPSCCRPKEDDAEGAPTPTMMRPVDGVRYRPGQQRRDVALQRQRRPRTTNNDRMTRTARPVGSVKVLRWRISARWSGSSSSPLADADQQTSEQRERKRLEANRVAGARAEIVTTT